MIITDTEIETAPHEPPDTVPTPNLVASGALDPHRKVALNGVLCSGRALPRSRQNIFALSLEALTDLVRQATYWAPKDATAEHHLGDCRFLILDTTTATGLDTFVQIWSEPYDNFIIEVGPGDREDPVLQAFANKIREPLLDRGYQIGGSAANFEKRLPTLAPDAAPRVARELLSLLTDVLGYDGCEDLSYAFHQDCHLRADFVVNGVNRDTLHMLMQAWGLAPQLPQDEDNVVEGNSLERPFRVYLFVPQKHRKNHFWEIHCTTLLTVPAKKATALLEEVNGRPHLFKAHSGPESAAPTQSVRLALGINLCGGVTLENIRCQIYEFLHAVHRLEFGS